MLRICLLAAAVVAATPAIAQVSAQGGADEHIYPGDPAYESRTPDPIPTMRYTAPYGKYDWNRPEPGKAAYFADDYYRPSGSWYGEKRLSARQRVYRGRDGRYYCRRQDGTTRPLDAVSTSLLGDALTAGGSAPIGTLGGPALTAALKRGRVRCGGEMEMVESYDSFGERSLLIVKE